MVGIGLKECGLCRERRGMGIVGIAVLKGEYMEQKLSEELKYCLNGCGCRKCVHAEEKTVLSCRSLLQSAYDKIKYFEGLEEQGLLLKLPCKVGDTVYYTNPELLDEKIEEYTVVGFRFGEQGCQISAYNHKGVIIYFYLEFIGKTVFLTQAEAEEALKRTESE